jgi:hypothetical protein
MSEEKTPYDYDLNYITASLGLVPLQEASAAINPNYITDIALSDDGASWIFCIEGGESYMLDHEEMRELEQVIRARANEVRLARKAALQDEARSTLEAQAKALADLNSRVAPGDMVIGGNRRFRQ